jgi:hypothetical protein
MASKPFLSVWAGAAVAATGRSFVAAKQSKSIQNPDHSIFNSKGADHQTNYKLRSEGTHAKIIQCIRPIAMALDMKGEGRGDSGSAATVAALFDRLKCCPDTTVRRRHMDTTVVSAHLLAKV